MLKIPNYRTFSDKIVPEVTLKVTGLAINRINDDAELTFTIQIVGDNTDYTPEPNILGLGVPHQLVIPYDVTSTVNPFEDAYTYLASLSVCSDAVRV